MTEAAADIQEDDYVELEHIPSIIWRVMEVQLERPYNWSRRKRFQPRARIEWELGATFGVWQKDRWEYLADLKKLNAMMVIARMAE